MNVKVTFKLFKQANDDGELVVVPNAVFTVQNEQFRLYPYARDVRDLWFCVNDENGRIDTRKEYDMEVTKEPFVGSDGTRNETLRYRVKISDDDVFALLSFAEDRRLLKRLFKDVELTDHKSEVTAKVSAKGVAVEDDGQESPF